MALAEGALRFIAEHVCWHANRLLAARTTDRFQGDSSRSDGRMIRPAQQLRSANRERFLGVYSREKRRERTCSLRIWRLYQELPGT